MRTTWRVPPHMAFGLLVAAGIMLWPFLPSPKPAGPSPTEVALQEEVRDARAASERLEQRLEQLSRSQQTFYRQWAEGRDNDIRDANRQSAAIDQFRAEGQRLTKSLNEVQAASLARDEQLNTLAAKVLGTNDPARPVAPAVSGNRPETQARPISRGGPMNQSISDQMRAASAATAALRATSPHAQAPAGPRYSISCP